MIKKWGSDKPKKKHYAVLLNGRLVEETWAVSAKRAISNVWWKRYKGQDQYSYTSYSVDDFDAVEL